MPSRARLDVAAVALLAGGLGAFALGNQFALDDRWLVVGNPFLRSLANLPRFFAGDYWEPTRLSGLYRPIATASYALNHALSGLDPRGWHAVNLLLHAANSALALVWLRRLTGRPEVARAAALVFAAHAVHAEVLANVASGRPELLAACFSLLALLTYRLPAVGRAPAISAASLAAFGLALLCKESAIALPAVLLLVDAVYGGAAPRAVPRLWLRRARVHGAYALVAIGYLGLRWQALAGGEWLAAERALDNPLAVLPLGARLVNAVWVGLRYAGLLVFPHPLAYDYSYQAIRLVSGAADPRLWLALAAAGLGVAAWIASARRSREVFFGVGFALATFSVVSNVLVPIGTILGERLLYLPSLGFCLALAALMAGAAARWCRTPVAAARALTAAVMALVALHAARAVDRVLDWRTENGLYVHDLAVNPSSFKIQSNAGAALAELGRHEEALRCFREAIAIAPEFPAPWRGRVLSLLALGRFDEAEAAYAETLRFGPPVPEVEAALRERRVP
jgi:tetratricopeptide (TPR) repeat protein